jgi:predicted dehydrogenase
MPQLTVGLIGAGAMAGVHLPAWQALGARVGIYSTDNNAERLAATAASAAAVTTLHELLDRHEVIDICTPTYTHKDLIVAAAEAGRHIICEKPLALTVEDAEQAIKATRAAGVSLFPAHVVRFFPEYATMATTVRAGALGTPAVLRFTRAGSYPTWSPWFADPELSGGILVDQMVHDFDFARLLAGEVTRVHARARGVLKPPAPPGSVAVATAVLTHSSGAISHVHGEWGLPATRFRTTFKIAGSKGVLEHDSAKTAPFRVTAERQGEGIPGSQGLAESPYLTELREFADAITGRTRSRVTAEDGLAAVRIAVAALKSSQTGLAVAVESAADPQEQGDQW